MKAEEEMHASLDRLGLKIDALRERCEKLERALRGAEDRAVLARPHLDWIIGFAETVGQSGLLHNACRARDALLAVDAAPAAPKEPQP